MFFRCVVTVLLVASAQAGSAEEALNLQTLIDEALRDNHEVLMAESKWKAASHRVRQAGSLPDPMVMAGYQNEGWREYTFGEMEGAQWMYSLSQMFPFPGKRSLKAEMAARDGEAAEAAYFAVRLRTVETVKSLYYDLFLAYRDIDIIRDTMTLFSRVEDAALARYASGMAPQQEVLMAQAEKYMLLERETMLGQKLQATEAMLNAAVGRPAASPLARPAEPPATSFPYTVEELTGRALERSPEIRSREKMREAAEANVGMARKEFFPDVTLAASVFKRSGEFEDMWSVTATFNIPLYFRAKQSAVAEARSRSSETVHDFEGTRLMVAAGIRDSHSMMKTAEKLLELYKQGLIPKTLQDFESAIAGYRAGKVEAITVISRLKTLLDYETLYWRQFVEREKAIARLEALTGGGSL
jgi:outer membrane protein TolC